VTELGVTQGLVGRQVVDVDYHCSYITRFLISFRIFVAPAVVPFVKSAAGISRGCSGGDNDVDTEGAEAEYLRNLDANGCQSLA